jgi:ribosomal protein L30/L7E
MNTDRLMIHATYVFQAIWIRASVTSAQVVVSLGFRRWNHCVVRRGPNLMSSGLQKLLDVIVAVPKQLKY